MFIRSDWPVVVPDSKATRGTMQARQGLFKPKMLFNYSLLDNRLPVIFVRLSY